MPAAIQKLPEELLREILSYAFYLSPESFCGSRSRWHSLARPSAFDKRQQPRRTCQDLLLVCKRWLRITTPLLYESLAIRTPAHATATAALLKATPLLGRAVRQLKIFGGYGKDMSAIANACPNVETLYVYVSVKSNESIVGIKKALVAFSPAQLYLENRRAYRNKKVDELHKLIDTQFEKWTRLREVHYGSSYTMHRPETLAALSTSTSLRAVWIDADALSLQLSSDAHCILSVLQGPQAHADHAEPAPETRTLHCIGAPSYARDVRELMGEAQFAKEVVDRVVFEDYHEKDIPPLPGNFPFDMEDDGGEVPPFPWGMFTDDEDEDEDVFYDTDEEEEMLGAAGTGTTMLLMAMLMASMR